MGLGMYIYAKSSEGLYVNLYCSGSARDGKRCITVKTDYPYGGETTIVAKGGSYKLFLRSPQWAPILSVEIDGQQQAFKPENGYIALEKNWNGQTVKLSFDMNPKIIYTSPEVQNNNGMAAVLRGPLVYCLEEVDNGRLLGSILMPHNVSLQESTLPDGLPQEAIALESKAYRFISKEDNLHSTTRPEIEKTKLKWIPYYLWANRGENEMRVYVKVETILPE
jgi:DUF1680 family protein